MIDRFAVSDRAYQIARHAVHTRAAIQDELELAAFLDLFLDQQPRVVVEVGTSMGGTFYALSQAAHPEALMISIDLGPTIDWPHAGLGELEQWAQPGQDVRALYGNSQHPTMRNRLQKVLGRRKIDVLFIDADHHWESVEADHQQYAPLVKKGGLVAFHDIHRHGFIVQEGCEVFQWWADHKAEHLPHPQWEFINAPAFGIGVYQK
jgi:predicted O-methyltransferase YrrM